MRPGNSTRDRILAAATAVFAERDFHRVQVSDVAVRAGVEWEGAQREPHAAVDPLIHRKIGHAP